MRGRVVATDNNLASIGVRGGKIGLIRAIFVARVPSQVYHAVGVVIDALIAQDVASLLVTRAMGNFERVTQEVSVLSAHYQKIACVSVLIGLLGCIGHHCSGRGVNTQACDDLNCAARAVKAFAPGPGVLCQVKPHQYCLQAVDVVVDCLSFGSATDE